MSKLSKMLASIAFFAVSTSFAHEYKLGSLHIVHPWTRATPEGAKVAGGFLKITNMGNMSDRLIGGTLLAANRFEVHEMSHSQGVMQMRQLEKGLEIPAGHTLELKPGGYHVMFMDLKAKLAEGENIKGTLVFEKAGTIEVEFKVEPLGHAPKQGGHHAH